MPVALQHNRRTSVAATIKRASTAGRRDMNRLDRRTLEQLDRTYRQAAAELETAIRGYAGSDGSLRLEVLQDLLSQVYARLQALSTARDAQLAGGLTAAAQQGIRPFSGITGDLTRLADEALRFVRTFVAEDGLQLSDRLWRIDRAARERVGEAIQSAVIQGHSASQAASEFLGAGQPVPADIQAKLGLASAESIAAAAGRALLSADGNARQSAMRLFRTELNRAHGEAYRAAAFETEGVIGTRFLLSPNHPEPDICDMHAAVNRYGLGPGVYPKGKSPWPAHPNTLSYEVVVFEDEVTDEDRAGKEDRITWLKRQPGFIQQGVLSSRRKRAALQQGLLKENEIATPWQVLKIRYQRRGVDIDTLTITPEVVARAPGPSRISEIRTEALNYVIREGEAQGVEFAVVYDLRTGNEFVRKTSRLRGAVNFDRDQLTIFRNSRYGLELVHNHPSSSSLSLADLRFATLDGIERITAIGHDGSLYSARSLGSPEDIIRYGELVDDLLMEKIPAFIERRVLSPAQANVLHTHIRNSVLDRLEMIDYDLERSAGMLKSSQDALGVEAENSLIDFLTREVRRRR